MNLNGFMMKYTLADNMVRMYTRDSFTLPAGHHPNSTSAMEIRIGENWESVFFSSFFLSELFFSLANALLYE